MGTVDDAGLYTAPEVPGEGTLTVTAGGISQTIAVSPTYVHTDVAEDHWAYTAVEYCYAHDIVSGVSSTEFGRTARSAGGLHAHGVQRPGPA